MKSKTQDYTGILSLRKYLQRIAQISYSYSQLNKQFSPLENLSKKDMEELNNFYFSLISDLKNIIKDFESEYEKPKVLETTDTN